MFPNPNFVSFLYLMMLISSILVTFIYIYFNWREGLFGRMMSITFALICYGLFTSFNAAQGFFIYLPHIARTGFLVLLTITPLLFLSLKIRFSNSTLKKQDFLHFIPSLIYFINFLPFYLLSTEEKVKIIRETEFTSLDEGWLFPKYFVLFLSLIQILFYLTITLKKILFPKIKNISASKEEKWFLYTYFIYLILLFLPPIATFFSGFSGKKSESPVTLIYISSQLIFFLFFLSQPKLLFSKKKMDFPEQEKTSPQETVTYSPKAEKKQLVLNQNPDLDKETEEILNQINTFMEKERPFLNFEFDQKDLSEKLNLSGYQIRNTLKNSYSLSFSDFVNFKRIQFLINELENQSKWRNYTMMALANSIGFKSTNSLYLAFKKFVNTTPKDYINELTNSI